MNVFENFHQEVINNINGPGLDQALHALTLKWIIRSAPNKYSYNFSMLGRPIISVPARCGGDAGADLAN